MKAKKLVCLLLEIWDRLVIYVLDLKTSWVQYVDMFVRCYISQLTGYYGYYIAIFSDYCNPLFIFPSQLYRSKDYSYRLVISSLIQGGETGRAKQPREKNGMSLVLNGRGIHIIGFCWNSPDQVSSCPGGCGAHNSIKTGHTHARVHAHRPGAH